MTDFKPPEVKNPTRFLIIGAFSIVSLLLITLGIIWWKCDIGSNESRDEGKISILTLNFTIETFSKIMA